MLLAMVGQDWLQPSQEAAFITLAVVVEVYLIVVA
jgi:hypothetical protein